VEDDYYTTGEAARILRVTEARVRQMLGAKELEGTRDPMTERWHIPQHAVHARLEKRRPLDKPSTQQAADSRKWIERVAELEREVGRLEGRLELSEEAESARLQLSEQAESTLREAWQRERERADRLEETAEQLRGELEAERSKGFWSRLFGG
jgi:excisionase family DNA binding protein